LKARTHGGGNGGGNHSGGNTLRETIAMGSAIDLAV
jgi:hypothetical protein